MVSRRRSAGDPGVGRDQPTGDSKNGNADLDQPMPERRMLAGEIFKPGIQIADAGFVFIQPSVDTA